MDEMKSLEEMRIEIEVLHKELEFQTKLVEFWEERCKQEFVEKMELWNKKLEMKKKYEGVLEELQERKKKLEGMRPTIQVSPQYISSNQVKGSEGNSHNEKRET